MTPEQLKAKQLLTGEIPFDERSAEGFGIDISQLTPKEKVELMNKQSEWKFTDPTSQANVIGAAAGGLNLPLPNLIKGVGKVGSKLSDWLAGKLTGLNPKQVELISKSPNTIKALQKASPLRKQQFAEKALESTSRSLNKNIEEGALEIAKATEGKTMPYTPQLRSIEDLAKQNNYSKFGMGADPLLQTVPASEVDATRKFLGKNATSWKFDPKTGVMSKSTNPEVGAAYGSLKEAEIKAFPEIEGSLNKQSQAFEALDPISRAKNRPAGFMEQVSTDTAAARQLADEAANRTRLQRTAEQMQVAKSLDKPSSGFIDNARKDIGLGIIKGSNVVGKYVGAPLTGMEDVGKRLGIANSAPVSSKPKLDEWTDDEWIDDEWIDDK